MIDKKFYIVAGFLCLATILTFAYASFGQPPRGRAMGWFQPVDSNKNGMLERDEYRTATDDFFKRLDRNNDGIIDEAERPRRPEGRRDDFEPERGGRGDNKPPFPFFVMESLRGQGNLTRAAFDENAAEQFKLMDKNGDGAISFEEAQARLEEVDARVKSERNRREEFEPFNSPTAQFVAAEMRFGDKLTPNAPFSAEIVIENTRRLFDGSTVTKSSRGAIYRDKEGRTRREQPLENIGGFNVVGENGSSQMLVFINDFPGRTHYFLDLNRRVARKNPLPENRPFLPEPEAKGGKTESLGTKTIEGVTVEGTRTTFEIPVGQLGNDKPIPVVTEKWFSPELQVVVYSRHLDPIAGEHIFRLVNIKKGEPSADLFVVPNGFRIENQPRPKLN